ncbi:DNA polymerase II [Candidatus Woesearchaeota archaeon]|nr:DNA polymerase II [Candidatus Woesearchaeota archaeon]
MKGYIVDSNYKYEKDKNIIHLYGRLENGESFLVKKEYGPYFYIKKNDKNKLEKLKIEDEIETEETDMKNFNDEEVVRIITTKPKYVKEIREKLKENDIATYEADIRFTQRYFIDNDIKRTIEIKGEYVNGEYVSRVYDEPDIKPAEWREPNLKLLSVDIETSKDTKNLYSISLYTENYKKCFINYNGNKKLRNAVKCENEKELIEKFKKEVQKLDPDIITGWNFVDFDLNQLRKFFEKHNIKFSIGRGTKETYLRIYNDFMRSSVANIEGRMVLDGIEMLRKSFISVRDYKLETVSRQFLSEGKTITSEGKNKGEEINRAYKENQEKLVEYNLKDAELVYRILNISGALKLSMERSLLTGMPLDRISATVSSFDSLYLRKLKEKGYVAENREFHVKEKPLTGGFVLESNPGIYDYVILVDFKSLYPSIIRTFNIDPLMFVEKPGKKEKNELIETPNKAYYKKEKGILPEIIGEIWDEREKAKKRKDNLANYALKIQMNSFYGALGNPTCRFFNPMIGNSITFFGQKIIKLTMEKIKEMGHEVIYGDTDSVFVNVITKDEKEAEKTGREIEKNINEFYKKWVKEKYGMESFLHLEFEKTFIRFFIPKIRHSVKGAKKRYAGLIKEKGKEKISITGLEFVRGDWTELSKKFQYGLLDKVFHKKEVGDYIRNFVKKLKKGEFDDELVYEKRITKPLNEYIKTTPPHVKAARKMKSLQTNLIKYIMTVDGPEPVTEIKHSIDYEHYAEKQLKPIADTILTFYNTNFDDVLKESKQSNLFRF